jgi:leucyl-tRNA synthetase
MPETETTPTISAEPPFRYNASLANEIELKWQAEWEKANAYYTPNPNGELANTNPEFNHHAENKPKMFVMDMFPYPSGAGLHVGHPLGFIATDVYSRFKRMTGFNVLYTMGMDAFGLPAEQYAIATNTHPRITTETNIANMNRQLSRIGLSHDKRRAVSTIDPEYFKWTQSIFLLIYNSYIDEETGKAAPIENLVAEFEAGTRDVDGKAYSELSKKEKADAIDQYRLAYLADSVVNWCPGLGTVLANEEVTADGKSERGNFDVFKRPMKQWMMRITAYADRLIDDLDFIDWPESLKIMQRNWIGKSKGAHVDFKIDGHDEKITAFTTRTDTQFGVTFLVLAPEHPLVGEIVHADHMNKVDEYTLQASKESDIDRQNENKEKTGVFTGSYALNPANGEKLPIYVADYVLMGYGTGAVMGVPAHDQRDFEFATKYNIEKRIVIEPSEEFLNETGALVDDISTWTRAYGGESDLKIINSSSDMSVNLNGLNKQEAIDKMCDWLDAQKLGASTTTYRLRDWLFSRQRYWGEPFPIVYDEDGIAHDIPTSMLPLELPTLENFAPESSDDPDAKPKPPLGRVEDWVNVELDLGRGDGLQKYTRETNTMPNWAGSCWYYLRYCDPENDNAIIDPAIEKYWAGNADEKSGMVDLYVGGVEHAVLHLLYARFWHKVLFDRGVVSTLEPFGKLFNQGMIQAFAYTDERGFYVDAAKVVERDGKYFYEDKPVNREFGKMGKSLKNIVTPDEMCETYGADTLRLYEMFMGPLDMSRPWSTADVSGVYRFLQRIWRNIIDEETGELKVSDTPVPEELRVIFNKTIDGVKNDYEAMGNNVAIAKMFELNNALTKYVTEGNECPREIAQTFALLLSPLAPHFASELYEKLGNKDSIIYADFPVADEKYLVEDTVEIPVQINGKVRSKIIVASDSDQAAIEKAARENDTIAAQLEGMTVIKAIVVPGRMCNFVVKPA